MKHVVLTLPLKLANFEIGVIHATSELFVVLEVLQAHLVDLEQFAELLIDWANFENV